MKKVFALALVILALAGVLAGCNNTNHAMESDVVWGSYEKFTYEVTQNGNSETGSYSTELRLVQNESLDVGLAHFDKVTNQLQINRFSFGDFSFVEVLLFGKATDKQKLIPIASYREQTTDGVTSYQTIVYDNEKAKAKIYLYSDSSATLDSVTPVEIGLASPYYDNAELYTLFRAAGSQIASWTINVPIAKEGQAVKLSVSTASSATISVPFKSDVKCKTVVYSRSDLAGKKYYAYYASDAIEINGKKIFSPLIEIVENDVIFKLTNVETE